ncbi:ABC transporter permease [Sphaerisporangium sp. TRM90804]|uniref:ABC transporter permease n=1 Tax=Sphaerisporangium sp. TRM90804 TaxID=3031113 RepID=UPI002448291E|nr:ABC transporter permease [Sphaerisporangium sp. TRM90804]MDH2425107.1 ABC transporter permease [Sphaerisporangium sp. TRM90804]
MRGRTPLVLRRAFSEPLLLFAAFGSILLATTTLVALTMYASTVADVGVRRAMATASATTTATKISAPIRQGDFADVDRAVRGRLDALGRGTVPHDIALSARSDSYAMPGQEALKIPELIRFGTYDGLERHARLQDGTWPGPATGDVVEVALSQPAARAMDVSTGREITVRSRLDDGTVRVRVAGIFQLTDPYSERWAGEELLRRGVERGNYTTYGPLMVSRDAFLSRFANTSVTVTWTAVPDLRNLTGERLRPFAASVAGLGEDLKRDCSSCETYSRLPDMLNQLDQAALVARSTMLIPVLQLLLLAAYALILTARLLADHRRMEVALLRSRGAGSVRLALLAGQETLLVALPCALAAPFLAPPLLRLVNAIPWIRSAGVRIAPEPDVTTFAIAAGVALSCAVLLALPAVRGARRTYVQEQASRGRGDRQGMLQRAGGDLALLVVAALAIWQLQRYGAPVTATASGELGVDPLIITGPALALLCGGMLGLRLVPRVSRIAERFTSRRASLAPALGAWQVSRRPLRYSGPALLLTMAVAIGVVSLATAATWRASQLDQARHQAGADLRVSGPLESAELGRLGKGAVYAGLPGVGEISPVYRGTATFPDANATLIAVDATKLTRMLMLRPDLSTRPVGAMAAGLADGRPATPVVPLPGTPRALTLDARLSLDTPSFAPRYAGVRLRIVLSDALGAQSEAVFGPFATDGEAHQVTADLTALAGLSGRLAYPLSIRGMSLEVPIPPQGDGPAEGSGLKLDVASITTDTGGEVAMPPDVRWGHIARGEGRLGDEEVTSGPASLLTVTVPAPRRRPGTTTDTDRIALVAAPAAVPNDELFVPPPAQQAGAKATATSPNSLFRPVPVVLTADIAQSESLSVGKAGLLTLDGQPVEITVAGIVTAMPGTTAGTRTVLADLPTLLTRDIASGREPRPAGEWWMSAHGDTAAAAAELARHPEWDQTVVDLGSLTRTLRDDPLASGLQGALILGFAAALVFAVLGFLVNAAVAARERLAEFAILRALGVGFRQIFGLLAVEQAFLVVLSLVGGTLLALGVTVLVVPHIVLTGQAAAVTPSVVLAIPWPATLAMLVTVAVLLFAIIAGLARSLRRHGLGRVLRIGEDR